MRLTAAIATFALLLVACSSTEPTTTTTAPESSSVDSADVYAVALYELVVGDNSFGGGGNPFSELLVQTSLDPFAGTADPGSASEVRPLTVEERDAIEAALSPLGPVRWIDDPEEWRTEELMPVVEGSAILGVGPITFDADGALVPMSMWCGGLCGTWFTYRVVESGGAWTVSGIEGPIAVS